MISGSWELGTGGLHDGEASPADGEASAVGEASGAQPEVQVVAVVTVPPQEGRNNARRESGNNERAVRIAPAACT